jgi:hypothetical protein
MVRYATWHLPMREPGMLPFVMQQPSHVHDRFEPPYLCSRCRSVCCRSLEYLVRHHALKLAPTGINVNCIVPGAILTDAYEKVRIYV